MRVSTNWRWIRTLKLLVVGHGNQLSETDHARPLFRRNKAKFGLNFGLNMVGAGFWRQIMSRDRDAQEEET